MNFPNTDSVDGITGNLTDWQSWPSEVWGFIAILVALIGAYWIWQNMGGKIQIVIVVVLLIAVFTAYAA